jgi:hypothetical protein
MGGVAAVAAEEKVMAALGVLKVLFRSSVNRVGGA